MLITDFTVTITSNNKIMLNWTGTLNYYSYVFVNGVAYESPIDQRTTTSRSITFTMPELFSIEIHEVQSLSEIDKGNAFDFVQRPFIIWTKVDGSSKYRVYHKSSYSGDETLRINEMHVDNNTVYKVQFNKNLFNNSSGLWNWFRVESVSATSQRESVTDPKPDFVLGLPSEPEDLNLSGTSPNLTLTLET